MSLMLLVSLYDKPEWSLEKEIVGWPLRNEPVPLELDGVTLVGSDAVLFDQTKAHAAFVQICAHLIAHQPEWPYFLVPVEASSILVEGSCGEFGY